MDLRAQLPLHVAMAVSMSEARGAKCYVRSSYGEPMVIAAGSSGPVREVLLAAGFFERFGNLCWLLDRQKLTPMDEWAAYSRLHAMPIRRQ